MNILQKIFIFCLFIIAGYLYGQENNLILQGLIAGAFFGLVSIIVLIIISKLNLGSIVGAFAGLITGVIFSYFFLLPLETILPIEAQSFINFAIGVLFGYGGLIIGYQRGKNLNINSFIKLLKGKEVEEDIKILDTSVIIDGRIADIIEIGFIGGIFIIPQFILQELQHIADSPDPIRRSKGRRGLDILHRIQKIPSIKVKIIEEDFPKIKEVDSKLVALARGMNAKIITNDFNLNKVAQLQGVPVLNINELASVLKPVVLPGEILNLFIVKEGKEYNQGVAYLDDGTMVVIENARRLIGKSVEVIVTSVLQTTAGRMIFAKPKEEE